MQPNLCTCGLKFAPYSRTSARFPLQAESVHQGHERRLGRAEGTLYVHRSRPGRAEGALYVQPACLDVQRILRTVMFSGIFQCIDILVPQIWHHAPHPSNDQNMPNNDVFSTTIITFSGCGGLRMGPKLRSGESSHAMFLHGLRGQISRIQRARESLQVLQR